MHVINRMYPHRLARQQWRNFIKDIVHLPTLLAIEMSMRINISVLAHPMLIYRDHLSRIVL